MSVPVLAPARGEDAPERKLKGVEKALHDSRQKQAQLAREAEVLAAEIAKLREDGIAAAHAAQAHETTLSQLEGELVRLAAEDKRKSEDLQRRRAQQTELLMALERLSLNPPEGLALSPVEPVDALRGALLMGAAVPPLEAQARALSEEIKALAALREEIAAMQERHRVEREALQHEQERLADLVARKAVLQQQATQDAEQSGQRVRQLVVQAKDLRELIERLEAERKRQEAEEQERQEAARQEAERQAARPAPRGQTVEVTAPPPTRIDPGKPRVVRPFTQARGLVVFPASGRLMRRYGDADELGVASKGLTLETRAGAQVVAPFDGRIEFAGQFRGYGQILIIEHGGGYHSLLAGLERVEGTVGQWLVAGEPVGTMGQASGQPRLYLELRHNGQPINPLPWLATHDEKVSG
jgi:septal ring factor EnvC (AmiA/AmiB activator)